MGSGGGNKKPMEFGGWGVPLNPAYAFGKDYMNKEEGKAKRAMDEAAYRQEQAAAKMQQTLLSQPKKVAPDNYLTDRARRLATLRLGLSSTMRSDRSAQAPALSVPTLSAVPSKKEKLGY